MTAEELLRSLESDSAHQTAAAARQAAMEAHAQTCGADETGLLKELAAAGVTVASVYEFVNGGGAPAVAVPVLVRHLELPHHPRVWEGIVRSLSVRHARAAALEPLKAQYREEREPLRRWTLANAIASMATFDEVETLDGITEYRNLFGRARQASL